MKKVLVVEDKRTDKRFSCELAGCRDFLFVEASGDDIETANIMRKERPDAIVLDLMSPEMSGLETLGILKRTDPKIPVIVVTACGNVAVAVEAMKLGAYDYLSKPVRYDHLVTVLERAMEKHEMDVETKGFDSGIDASIECLLGRSDRIKKVIEQIYQVAWSDLSVILQGETGTGKSFVANVIHNLSERRKGPFIKVDMGAIPENLVESEIFGYERGAFTGAERNKKGFFEIADGGTILVDEVQNASQYVQGKLLTVAEEKKIYPVGGTKTVVIDVRILAATNMDMRQAVREKKFREDLYFRLGEFIIEIPPLRDRIEDVPFLAEKFCSEYAFEMKKKYMELSADSMARLKSYSWPGNVRELKNAVKRAVLVTEENVIRPENIVFLTEDSFSHGSVSEFSGGAPSVNLPGLERMAIKQALEQTNGNKTKAAALLKISYATLYRKIKRHKF